MVEVMIVSWRWIVEEVALFSIIIGGALLVGTTLEEYVVIGLGLTLSYWGLVWQKKLQAGDKYD